MISHYLTSPAQLLILPTAGIFHPKSVTLENREFFTCPSLPITKFRAKKENERKFICRYPDCEWGPTTTSYRAKHERSVHGQLYTEFVKGPIHNQGAGPSQGSGRSGTTDTGFDIFARGKDTGTGLRGELDRAIQRNLSP